MIRFTIIQIRFESILSILNPPSFYSVLMRLFFQIIYVALSMIYRFPVSNDLIQNIFYISKTQLIFQDSHNTIFHIILWLFAQEDDKDCNTNTYTCSDSCDCCDTCSDCYYWHDDFSFSFWWFFSAHDFFFIFYNISAWTFCSFRCQSRISYLSENFFTSDKNLSVPNRYDYDLFTG